MTLGRSSIGLVSAGVVTVLLFTGITHVSAQRSWTFAGSDGAGLSAFYDTDGGDVLVEFRNQSTLFAHIQYQISCEGRGPGREWEDASQTSVADMTVTPDRASETRWTCSRSWTSASTPSVRDVRVQIFHVIYDDHP